MIVWINGAFGSGKTSTARELNKRLKGSKVYDPEEVGLFLREHVPGAEAYSDFQDHPLWATLNYDILKHLDSQAQTCVIVPMTLVNEQYYGQIISKLREGGTELLMYTLLASKKTITSRLTKRGEVEGSWAFQQIDRCLEQLYKPKFDKHIDTEDKCVNEVVDYIESQLSEGSA
jgi:cytidylate kinase